MSGARVRFAYWSVVSRSGEKALLTDFARHPDTSVREMPEATARALARHYARETKAGAEAVGPDGTPLEGGEYLWDPKRAEVVRVRSVRLAE
jgi:hypothetical protein